MLVGDFTKKNSSVPRYADKYSVTQFVSALFPGHYSQIPIQYLIKASERGKLVHELIHLHDMQLPIDSSKFKPYFNYLDAYLEYREANKQTLIQSEYSIIDNELNIAGTLDKMFSFHTSIPNTLGFNLVDLKTRKVFYLMDVFQVNAYAVMYKRKHNTPVTKRNILSLVKKPNGKVKYKLTDVYNKQAEEIFKIVCTHNVLDKKFVMPQNLKKLTQDYVKAVAKYE